ncbi:hydantoinase/oxoprolinase family protein [Streptomyces djakartensis]|uniref:Methylhydantoinase n=1 Tax=Streptomyces djakartensis TaxID=68193 RepID=A0ABQ3A5V5_9ACTN|nr:hydantoinase/oxoprolinase family protein [Streptomyces djakartensis]GGY33239.1 methylhydantoinase [Streptomyces djakartensis]
MRFRVGTDVGGTFTDLWVYGDDGRQAVLKAPSTADIIGGILRAVELAADHFELSVEEFCASIDRFGHGTTAGLNALLTSSAAPTALITTAGFRDTLEIGRLKRQLAGLTELEIGDYRNRGRWPAVVPRQLVFEIGERVDSAGEVVVPLERSEIDRVLDLVAAAEVEAVAVATLWSVANPEHEQRIAAALRERFPQLFVSLSHEVAPAVGEYARMSTTAVNAALGPVMSAYLRRLDEALRQRGLAVPVVVMTSEGGVVSADVVSDQPVSVLMSGPAAGVIACREIGHRLGHDKLLTVDVGGTSFDVGTVVKGEPLMRSRLTIGGADIQRPAIDVGTIGAGGGSIARVRDGALTVGPFSAGARPGPVCYGRGGTEPTATDADLVLGVLDEEDFAGGTMRLDRAAAADAIEERVAKPLGLGVLEAAWGIRQVLDSKMADLLRSVTIEKGHDPREFVLFAGGGQGPSHAWALCRELGIRTFVVTPTATGQSAFGTGTCELKRTVSRPHYLRLPGDGEIRAEDVAPLAEKLAAMTAEAEAASTAGPAQGERGELTIRRTAAIRYRGQAHHLDVPVAEELSSPAALGKTLRCFEEQYEALYGTGSAFREAGFELTGLRVLASRRLDGQVRPAARDELEPHGTRGVVFDDPLKPVDCQVHRTAFPAPGQTVSGPCLVMFPGQTLVVPPGAVARTDELGDFVVTLDDTEDEGASR